MALLAILSAFALSQVVINEVSDSGSPNFCSGDDWVELANAGSSAVDLTNWKLCDSDGCSDSDAYTFTSGTTLPIAGYLAVCHLQPVNQTIRRWIGKNDTITLYDNTGSAIDTSGALGGLGEFGRTWARSPDVSARA